MLCRSLRPGGPLSRLRVPLSALPRLQAAAAPHHFLHNHALFAAPACARLAAVAPFEAQLRRHYSRRAAPRRDVVASASAGPAAAAADVAPPAGPKATFGDTGLQPELLQAVRTGPPQLMHRTDGVRRGRPTVWRRAAGANIAPSSCALRLRLCRWACKSRRRFSAP